MVNYQNGKVYKLVSPNGLVYVGSTCMKLSKRKADHKGNYLRWKNGKQNYVTSYKLFEENLDEIDVVLIENCPCNSKEELHKRERHYIDSMVCVNKQKPNRSIKEWRADNKEAIAEKSKEWRQNNKEKIATKRSESVKCSCGTNVTYNKQNHSRKNSQTS
jgi:hypothetical protein